MFHLHDTGGMYRYLGIYRYFGIYRYLQEVYVVTSKYISIVLFAKEDPKYTYLTCKVYIDTDYTERINIQI